MRRILAFLLLLTTHSVWAGGHKEYPLTLKILDTRESVSESTSVQTRTNCSTTSGTNDVNCLSRQTPGPRHVALISIVEALDGNTYEIECVPGLARSFFSGADAAGQAYAGTLTTTYSGCAMRPGTYQARWDKRLLKVLIHANGKEKEMTFEVLSVKPNETLGPTGQKPAILPPTTRITISSNPPNAEIKLDGAFVGTTLSTVPVASGVHTIIIDKKGYKPWKREITTSGGEVNLAADLESQ